MVQHGRGWMTAGMRGLLMGTALAIIWSQPGWSDEVSAALVDEGLTNLQAGDLAGATDTFIAAYEADPSDPMAVFYVGVGMNRMGDFVQAMAAFEEARRLGYADPELEFESGWALLALGQTDLAIARLEAYEASKPGRGKTSEFLGRA